MSLSVYVLYISETKIVYSINSDSIDVTKTSTLFRMLPADTKNQVRKLFPKRMNQKKNKSNCLSTLFFSFDMVPSFGLAWCRTSIDQSLVYMIRILCSIYCHNPYIHTHTRQEAAILAAKVAPPHTCSVFDMVSNSLHASEICMYLKVAGHPHTARAHANRIFESNNSSFAQLEQTHPHAGATRAPVIFLSSDWTERTVRIVKFCQQSFVPNRFFRFVLSALQSVVECQQWSRS